MKAWINGEFVDWEHAQISLLSHSFGRGSAIFEVFDIVEARKGVAFFGLNEHIDRLFTSAELTYMELPLSKKEITDACMETALENEVRNGATKLFAYYPGMEIEVYPRQRDVHVAIFCLDFDRFGMKREELAAPVDVGVTSYRKFHPETIPVHAKVCGSYVSGYLAMSEMKKKGYQDVINLDLNGHVAEGATSSVFFIKNGSVRTARPENVLKGITRMAVIEIAKEIGISLEETDILPTELPLFDEAFYAVSAKRIQPIRSIDGKKVGGPCPGPITDQITAALNEIYDGTNSKLERWLTYIR